MSLEIGSMWKRSGRRRSEARIKCSKEQVWPEKQPAQRGANGVANGCKLRCKWIIVSYEGKLTERKTRKNNISKILPATEISIVLFIILVLLVLLVLMLVQVFVVAFGVCGGWPGVLPGLVAIVFGRQLQDFRCLQKFSWSSDQNLAAKQAKATEATGEALGICCFVHDSCDMLWQWTTSESDRINWAPFWQSYLSGLPFAVSWRKMNMIQQANDLTYAAEDMLWLDRTYGNPRYGTWAAALQAEEEHTALLLQTWQRRTRESKTNATEQSYHLAI